MIEHSFGGNWTDDKLECLRKYLDPYRCIFTQNIKASSLTTIYIDAFAGTGYRTRGEDDNNPNQLPLSQELDGDTESYIKGSARIALEIKSPFDKYIFIEKNQEFVKELEKLRSQYPSVNIEITPGDANIEIPKLCRAVDWRKTRAVLFLDPYGMAVNWNTIEVIAATHAIDMWLLFPLGALNRMLTTDRLPPLSWQNKISAIFGNDDWKSVMYQPDPQLSFFDDMQSDCKNVSFDSLGQYIITRLKSIFPGVASQPLQLCNSKNSPIFLLCFAAGNEKGSSTAIRIANNILGKQKR